MVKLEWLVVAVGLAAVVVLAVQVALARPDGFVTRTSWSLAGLVVVAAVVTGVLWLAGALG